MIQTIPQPQNIKQWIYRGMHPMLTSYGTLLPLSQPCSIVLIAPLCPLAPLWTSLLGYVVTSDLIDRRDICPATQGFGWRRKNLCFRICKGLDEEVSKSKSLPWATKQAPLCEAVETSLRE